MSQSVRLKPSEDPLSTFNDAYCFYRITGILVTSDGQLLLSGDQHLLLLHPDRTKAEKIHCLAGNASCITWAGQNTFASVDMGNYFCSDVYRATIGKGGIKIVGKFATDAGCTTIAYIDNHFILGALGLAALKVVDENGKLKRVIGQDFSPSPGQLDMEPTEVIIDGQYRIYAAHKKLSAIFYFQLNKTTFLVEMFATKTLKHKVSTLVNVNHDVFICGTMSGKILQFNKAGLQWKEIEDFVGNPPPPNVQMNPEKMCCHGNNLLMARKSLKYEVRIEVFDVSLSQDKC